jgi:hypothetical protein
MNEYVLEHYISLVVEQPLNTDLIRDWYQTVKKYSPAGTITGAQVIRPNHGRVSASLVHTIENNKHCYKIPLTRDLTDREIEKIIDRWVDDKDFDFNIETGVTQHKASHHTPDDAIEVTKDTYRDLCETLARYLHNKWYKERVDLGWNYGVKLSHKNKTHPMLLPWEQLPKQYRKIDTELPKVFIKTLNDIGYAVLDKQLLHDLGWDL